MSLFNWGKKPHTITDDVFGLLKYCEHEDASTNCFEGRGMFVQGKDGPAAPVEYLVYAAKAGPTPEQRSFYLDLQTHFDYYIARMIPMIEKEFVAWGKPIQVLDFKNEFSVFALSIFRSNGTPIKWEITLDTIHDTNHQVIIDFAGDEPCDILIDV
ncbi:MAG: hypothetical protein V4649_11475 [Bacteroidota bacterium]